ncbi:MAG: TonB-dependent receptor [Gallionellaceae bacterium]
MTSNSVNLPKIFFQGWRKVNVTCERKTMKKISISMALKNDNLASLLFISAFTAYLSMTAQAQAVSLWEEEQALLQIYGDEEMVSIASGYKQPISKAPSIATIITASKIKATGATSIDQVLEMIPGLHVSHAQTRLDPIYTLRGFSSTFSPGMLMMINGVGIDSLFFGSRFAGFRLPVENIERVEVIRGPGSAIYGADAFVGVVNIVTKDSEAINGGEAGVRGGSFDSLGVWAQYGGKLSDNLNLAISTEWQSTSGDKGRRVASDMQTTLDGWYGTSASNAPGSLDTRYGQLDTRMELGNEKWKLRFWNRHLVDSGYGPGVSQALNTPSRLNSDTSTVDLSYNAMPTSDWEVDLHTSYLQYDGLFFMEVLPPGTAVQIGNDGNVFTAGGGVATFTDGLIIKIGGAERHYTLDTSAVYSGMNNHRFRFAGGASYKKFDTWESTNFGPGVLDGANFKSVVNGTLTDITGTPNIWAPNKSRSLEYISLQDEWSFARDWVATIGARYDQYSDFGGSFNPRLAMVWQTRNDLTTKLLYGRAFRPPALVELYPQNNPVTLGNPNLQPETIDTNELVFDYRPSAPWRMTLNLYNYKAKNLIRFEPDGQGNSIAQNTGAQRGYGFELEGEWKARDNLKLGVNTGWVHAEDQATGRRIADVPAYQAQLWASWRPAPNWTQHCQASYIAARSRIANDPRSRINDYTLVNLSLRYRRPALKWETALLIRNLFGTDAREPSPGDPGLPGGAAIPGDYRLEGRKLMFELRYQM